MSQKHVLIITYYWPPAGGPGVQRWLKFSKYLPDNGICPIVYCPENPSYPIEDKSLLKEIPRSVEVLKAPISEPYKWASRLSKGKTKTISSGIIPKAKDQSLLDQLLLFVRGNFYIPDARKNWVKPSLNFLKPIIENRSISCVITTGPPHSLHLIGLQLKTDLNLSWIADFRDPWTTIGYHKSLKLMPSATKKHLAMEGMVLQSADEIIVTSEATRREFQQKTAKPVSVITNGYDTHTVRPTALDTKFSLSHIGSLLSDRNPEVLWEVLSEMIAESDEFKAQLELNLIGVTSEDIVAKIKAYGLNAHLNIIDYVSHDEAIRYQLKSQLLLLIEINSEDTKAIIPGKLFEYLQSERPILAIGPKESDVETILGETHSGSYFYYSSKEELKSFIWESFQKFKKEALVIHPVGLKQYSRAELTKKLAGLLNKYL
jgi:hypothetical protein